MSCKAIVHLWIFIVFAFSPLVTALRLDITPNVYYTHIPGVTIQINCSTLEDDIFAPEASALKITRDDGKTVATIDKNQKITTGDIKDIKVAGHIDQGMGDVSYLSVKIVTPTCKVAGTYTCLKESDGDGGDATSAETKAKLMVDTSGSDEHELILKKITDLIQHFSSKLQLNDSLITQYKDLQKSLEDLEEKIPDIYTKVSQLFTFMKKDLHETIDYDCDTPQWKFYSGDPSKELCIRVSNDTLTWRDAKKRCEALGTTLVMPDNKPFYKFIKANLPTKDSATHCNRRNPSCRFIDHTWMGIYRDNELSPYKWANGTIVDRTDDFIGGLFRRREEELGDCLTMHRDLGPLTSLYCEISLNYICQKKAHTRTGV